MKASQDQSVCCLCVQLKPRQMSNLQDADDGREVVVDQMMQLRCQNPMSNEQLGCLRGSMMNSHAGAKLGIQPSAISKDPLKSTHTRHKSLCSANT